MRKWITSWLAALDYDIADKIKREFRVKERGYKNLIKNLESDKASYLSQIATNETRHAQDMVELKALLSEIQDELTDLRKRFEEKERELDKSRAMEIDLSGMLEAFMEAYPEIKLLDISKKRNPETIS